MSGAMYPKIDTVWQRDEQGVITPGAYTREAFHYLDDRQWVATEKVDGTNIRVTLSAADMGTHFDLMTHFGGRTDNAQIPAPLVAVLQEKFMGEAPRARILSQFPFLVSNPTSTVVLYGEGYGKGIQKVGAQYLPDRVDFVLFDVLIGGLWMDLPSLEDIAHGLKIDVVPVVAVGTLKELCELAKRGQPMSEFGAPRTVPMEGFVMQPLVRLCDRRGERIITKIKHQDYVRARQVQGHPS